MGFNNVTVSCIFTASFLVFVLFQLPDNACAEPHFVSSFCVNETGLYTPNSNFEKNLSLILLNLTAASSLRGFYNATAGTGLDEVHAVFYCRGDMTSKDCHDCVQTASTRIRYECETEKGAIAFFEECTLRYATRSMFALEEEDPNDWSVSDTLVSNKDQLNGIITTAMSGLMELAAFNSTFRGFSTGVTNFSVNQTLYCLVQCTPDILGSPCHKCLTRALDLLIDEGKSRIYMFLPSCQAMYSLSPFFSIRNSSSSLPFNPTLDDVPGSPSNQVPSSTRSNEATSHGTSPSANQSQMKMYVIVGVLIPVAVIGLLLFLAALWFFSRKKKKTNEHQDESFTKQGQSTHNIGHQRALPVSMLGLQSLAPTATFPNGTFTYEELSVATYYFSSENLLGEGGFGYVHKGVMPDGREVAVKQLKLGSSQGEHEFQAEVHIISRIHHRHLVSLVGYCTYKDQRLLVYEFISNNTLEFHLHGGDLPSLSWEKRLKIALGAAKGLSYLHEDCQPKIIHRDIKATNILLDNEFEAKVADFGLARFFLDSETHVSTAVKGTFGYLAPEYASTGQLTEKSDVYSFGVLLLELITGRRPVEKDRPFMDEGLVEWAMPLLNKAVSGEQFDGLIDPQMKDYETSEMIQMIACAAVCVRSFAKERPKLSQVVQALKGNISVENLLRETDA